MINSNTEKEIWVDIKGFKGIYKISNHGRVYSLKNNIIRKPKTNNRGYWQIALHKDGKEHMFLLHRLVAIHFVNNPHNYPQVNHKDENKDNNRADNLEWCTNEYNALYGTRIERVTNNEDYQKSRMKMRRKVRGTSIDGLIVVELKGIKEGEKLGFSRSGIGGCLRGVNKTHRGFRWEYVDEVTH